MLEKRIILQFLLLQFCKTEHTHAILAKLMSDANDKSFAFFNSLDGRLFRSKKRGKITTVKRKSLVVRGNFNTGQIEQSGKPVSDVEEGVVAAGFEMTLG